MVMVDGKPYAVAKDVAVALGYVNTAKAIRDHCKNQIDTRGNDSLWGSKSRTHLTVMTRLIDWSSPATLPIFS